MEHLIDRRPGEGAVDTSQDLVEPGTVFRSVKGEKARQSVKNRVESDAKTIEIRDSKPQTQVTDDNDFHPLGHDIQSHHSNHLDIYHQRGSLTSIRSSKHLKVGEKKKSSFAEN